MQDHEEKILVTEHHQRRAHPISRTDDRASVELYKVECAARIKLYKVQCKLFSRGALPCPPVMPDFDRQRGCCGTDGAGVRGCAKAVRCEACMYRGYWD